MNPETEDLIANAREKLKAMQSAPINDKEDFRRYQAWSQARCAACDSDLEVVRTEKIEGGVIYAFACGHKHVELTFSVTAQGTPSFEAASLKTTPTGQQTVKARRSGFRGTKEGEEISLVQTFAFSFSPELVKFTNDVQDSAVDVIAESSDAVIREVLSHKNVRSRFLEKSPYKERVRWRCLFYRRFGESCHRKKGAVRTYFEKEHHSAH